MQISFLINGTEHVHIYPSDYGWHIQDGFLHVVRALDEHEDDNPDYELEGDGDVMWVASYPEYSIQYIRCTIDD